ncbi:MAG: hypothetical protein CM1200mP2_48690 [Planctomycetaceae bacterium]|nr:MAG: hypothetical protein CM1200mP2_48690 [Planctomycetaceae bacterium]
MLGELGCTSCHPPGTTGPHPKRGPRLEGAGRRLQAKWLSRFLSDPAGTQPGTTMPDVLHGVSGKQKTEMIAALSAFLASLREDFAKLKSTATRPVAPRFHDKGDPSRGNRLFHQVGCVACHQPDAAYTVRPQPTSELEKLLSQLDPEELKELGLGAAARPFPSVPHGDLANKYTRQGLAHFLIAPESMRPGGRMPSLKLVPEKRQTWSRSCTERHSTVTDRSKEHSGPDRRGPSPVRPISVPVLPHGRPGTESRPGPLSRGPPPLPQLNLSATKSCLANASGRQPRYRLDKQQTQSIAAALPGQAGPAKPRAVAETNHVETQLPGLSPQKGAGGWAPSGGATSKPPAMSTWVTGGRLPPSLDGVGGKTDDTLVGQGAGRHR